jgi:exopolysaccharide biosynthesis polyprenyl glycosylphosphotransferase
MINYLFSNIKKRQYIIVCGDILVICISIVSSYTIKFYLADAPFSTQLVLSRFSPWLLLIFPIHLFSLHLLDQYNMSRLYALRYAVPFVILSIGLSGLLISGLFFFVPKYVFGRQVLIIHLCVMVLVLVLWRYIYFKLFLRKYQQKTLSLIGEKSIVDSFAREVGALKNCGFIVRAVCAIDGTDKDCSPAESSIRTYRTVNEALSSDAYDVIAYDSTISSFGHNDLNALLQKKYKGKAIYDLPTLYMNLTGKVPLMFIDGRWLLNNDKFHSPTKKPYIKAKRIIDICLASFLLILTAPIFLFISVCIKLESKGDMFFCQTRLGLNKKPFRCYKFRTMVNDAEKETGPIWTTDDDPRITKVGKILRKSRLDELPQLINILKGDMSFVGPRPIREYFAKKLESTVPFYNLRFSVKPGLSGWAQVNLNYAGTNSAQIEKFQYELFYIYNLSFVIDLITIIKTVKKTLRIEGT